MEVSGFPHQVGGHFGLLSIPGHVCKPLNEREYDFYTQLDSRLQPFAAKLCGRIKVQCIANQTDEDGALVMSTETLVDCHRQSAQNNRDEQQQQRLGMADSANSSTATLSSFNSSNSVASMSTTNIRDRRQQQQSFSSSTMTFRVKSGRVETAEKSMCNLWAGQCQSKVVQKLLKGHDRSFILLENLVANYARPCVIDLKMGTRQYGDDASAQKRLTQTQKCRQSTSSIFGVRLVGMQIYEPENEEYMFVNKYEGRRMDRVQFHDSLLQFFKMAGKQRTQRLIEELRKLRKVLVDANGFRFFSSSLLIAFDGELSIGSKGVSQNGEITLKMIDFAHSTFNGFLEDAPYNGIDEGYILGIDSLLNFLTMFIQSGLKQLGPIAPGQLCNNDSPSQKRTPLKRKMENGEESPEMGTTTATNNAPLDCDEESSLNSSHGFTSADSGTEMGEGTATGEEDEETGSGIQVNIPAHRHKMGNADCGVQCETATTEEITTEIVII